MLIIMLIVFSIQEIRIEGKISDANHRPIEYANIYIEGSSEGTVSDNQGFFSFKSKQKGTQNLIVEFMGYESHKEAILFNSDVLNLTIVLVEKLTELDIVEVTASAFVTDEKKQAVIARPIQVLTTPGANADILRFFHAMPGVTQTDEGAGIFVRGGDVSESIMILDGATILHPYRQESASGGFWGSIPPFLTKSSAFYTGALSAKYGNVLSGVVDMQTVDLPERSQYHFGVGLSQYSMRMDQILKENTLSISASGNYSDTRPIFSINKSYNEFSQYPLGYDLNLNLNWQLDAYRSFKFFTYRNHDELSLWPQLPTRIEYQNKAENNVYLAKYKHIFQNEWISESIVSFSEFSKDDFLGRGGASVSDQLFQLKWMSERIFKGFSKLKLGAEFQSLRYDYNGNWHFQPDSIVKGISGQNYNLSQTVKYQAFYLEYAYPFTPDFVIQAGLRFEHDDPQNSWAVDPRIAMSYRFNKQLKTDFAFGIFHQQMQAKHLVINPNLTSQKSIGSSAGIQFQADENTLLKTEIYYKSYSDLRKKSGSELAEEFDNSGYGYAFGNDFIYKFNGLSHEYWLSYSYLKARRHADFFVKLSPPSFDITHTLSMVYKYNFSSQFNMGFRHSHRTGKPYRFSNSPSEYNSKRLENYSRSDIQFSYVTTITGNDLTVFYCAINNIFDKRNVLDRIYNADFSQHTDQYSTFSLMFYFGFTASI